MSKMDEIFWSVSVGQQTYFTRILRLFRNFLFWSIFVALGAFVCTKSFADTLACYFLFLFICFFYCVYLAKNHLLGIRFFKDEDRIEIILQKKNKVKSICYSKNILQFAVEKSLTSKTTAWELRIVADNKIVHTQKDILDWTKEMFLEIDDNYKKYKSI